MPLNSSAAAAFGVLGAIHVYWLLGGRRGKAVAVPSFEGSPIFRPSAGGTAGAAVLFFLAGLISLAAHPAGCLGLAAILALRAIGDFRWVGFFKRTRGTPFARWDTRLYSPLCAALSALCYSISRM